MKRFLIFTLVIGCLLMLTGCKSIDHGTVVDKAFSPAHKVWSPIIMHVNNRTQIIPRWINSSALWTILVENGDERDWWSVSEDYYNSVEVGDIVERRKTEQFATKTDCCMVLNSIKRRNSNYVDGSWLFQFDCRGYRAGTAAGLCGNAVY